MSAAQPAGADAPKPANAAQPSPAALSAVPTASSGRRAARSEAARCLADTTHPSKASLTTAWTESHPEAQQVVHTSPHIWFQPLLHSPTQPTPFAPMSCSSAPASALRAVDNKRPLHAIVPQEIPTAAASFLVCSSYNAKQHQLGGRGGVPPQGCMSQSFPPCHSTVQRRVPQNLPRRPPRASLLRSRPAAPRRLQQNRRSRRCGGSAVRRWHPCTPAML